MPQLHTYLLPLTSLAAFALALFALGRWERREAQRQRDMAQETRRHK